MPRPSAHAMSILLDVIRKAWWSMVAGFAVLGAAYYGGATVSSAWRRAALATPSEPADVDVESEAARGIAEIESFLAGASPDAGSHRTGNAGQHRSADAGPFSDHRPSDPDPSSAPRRRHRRS